MAKENIQIFIDPKGKVVVDINMPVGNSCDEVSDELRLIVALLGAELEEVSEKINRSPQRIGLQEDEKSKVR